MSEANKQLAVRWFDEVWNQRSESAIDAMFSSEGKSHGFPQPDSVLIGPEAFKAIHRNFLGAFPDLHVTIEDLFSEGDKTAVRWRVDMTHTGDHLGFPASGKTAVLTGVSLFIANGQQILDGWNFMDNGALFQYLQAPSA
jgi:steroid delta-isomerase-like uncharacterized protein